MPERLHELMADMLIGKEHDHLEDDGKDKAENENQGQYWIIVLLYEHRWKETFFLFAHAQDLKRTRIKCEDSY